jgi:general secretion pathway protein K
MVGARARGFVLVLVLAMLVILSILAGTVAAVSQRLRDQELDRKRLEDAEIDLASTKATLVYLLLTQRMTFGGLTVDERMVLTEDEQAMQGGSDRPISLFPVGNEIALDGRAYAGLGSTAFALQDDRGLLGVNWTLPQFMERWWAQLDYTTTPAPTLANLLLDYQDEDDLYRLNSAERRDYLREGRAPPLNLPLATPLELRLVKGWDKALAGLDDDRLLRTLTVARMPAINVNTAPVEVLQVLPGIDAGTAERIVARRALAPFTHLSAFHGFIGGVVAEEDRLSLYPSDSGTMRLWAPLGGGVHTVHWTLTPWDDGGRPWREDYGLTLPQDPGNTVQALARPAAALLAKPLLPAGRRAAPPK